MMGMDWNCSGCGNDLSVVPCACVPPRSASVVQAEKKEFVIYSLGLCYASVCSSLPQAAVEARMAQEPTGIESTWKLAQTTFRNGDPNPCPCNTQPATHKHYLFDC